MKPLHAALLVSLVLTPAAAFAAQARPAAPARATSSPAIAFVSVQKILSESTAARAAAQQLEQMRKAKTEEVNARKKALDATRLAIANAGGVFSRSRRAELVATEQKQEAELRQATEEAQKGLVDLQREVQNAIRTDLTRVMNDIARERAVQYILNADTSLVWARDATDLTGEVVQRLNAAAAKPPAR